jgi:hypothetical protein
MARENRERSACFAEALLQRQIKPRLGERCV